MSGNDLACGTAASHHKTVCNSLRHGADPRGEIKREHPLAWYRQYGGCGVLALISPGRIRTGGGGKYGSRHLRAVAPYAALSTCVGMQLRVAGRRAVDVSKIDLSYA
eukprot:1550783-Rhodomonas_salina.2